MKPQKYKPQHPRNGKPIHLCIYQLQSKVVIAARLQLAYNFLAGLGARKIYTNPLELVSCEVSIHSQATAYNQGIVGENIQHSMCQTA